MTNTLRTTRDYTDGSVLLVFKFLPYFDAKYCLCSAREATLSTVFAEAHAPVRFV